MSDNERRWLAGPEEQVQYGEYLLSLHGKPGYTFEIEQDGRMRDRTLEEVVQNYRDFLTSDAQTFKVRVICCVGEDFHATTKEFRRLKSAP
jgi:hypothetical protein